MTKYSKRNRFSTIVIAGIFFSLLSCEKDTGHLGLDTLPSTDGISIHYDSVTINGYAIEPDPYIVSETYAEQLGSTVDNLGDGIYDTIVAEVIIPLYFPVWHSSSRNISNVASVSFKFSDKYNGAESGYIYGDTTVPLQIILEELKFENDSTYSTTVIDTAIYDPSTRADDTAYSHELPKEISDRIIAGIQKTISAYPYNDQTEYADSIDLADIRQYFINESGFEGLRCRIANPGNSFISRIIAPHIELKFKYNATDENFQSFRLNSYSSDEADDDIKTPSSTIYHSARINKEGALIQGLAGHRTTLDFSFLESWLQDSTRHSFARAWIDFPYLDNPDGRNQLDTLLFSIVSIADEKEIYTNRIIKDADNSVYSFQIQRGLNTLLGKNYPYSNYIFQLRCPNNNMVAEKSFIDYKNGNMLRLTYTKY